MPTLTTHTIACAVPSVADFSERFPRYGNFAANQGQFLFNLLMTPQSYVAAEVATVDLDRPAIAGVAKRIRQTVRQIPADQRPRKWGALKQFAGAVVCALMEANGFRKTGLKRSVSIRGFNRGEVYRRKRQSPAVPQPAAGE
jgi:hypothetical protein